MDIQEFVKSCPPVGAKKKYIVTCNNQPFAGFSSKKEAEIAKAMYSVEINTRNGLAYCSKQEWAVKPNPDYNQ
jgi:hypothetical protein